MMTTSLTHTGMRPTPDMAASIHLTHNSYWSNSKKVKIVVNGHLPSYVNLGHQQKLVITLFNVSPLY